MSAGQTEILEGIRDRIASVKTRLKEHETLNRELLQKNEELQQEIRQKESRIEELEDKNQKLTLVKSIAAQSDDAGDARIQINRIVREIDKCIALLNRT